MSSAELKQHRSLFDSAMLREFSNFREHGVMEEIRLSPEEYTELSKMSNIVGARWVITWKKTDSGVIPKCRLVAKGFADLQAATLRTDSPTVSKLALMVALYHAVNAQWVPHSLDMKVAFLQSDPYTEKDGREVYLVPPDDAYRLLGYSANEIFLWRLLKTTYGLKDAPLQWYKSLARYITGVLGLQRTTVDECLFVLPGKGFLAIHVDDIIFGGDKDFHSLIHKLCTHYKVGSIERGDFTYCGISITSVFDANNVFSIQLDQIPFILSLVEMPVPHITDNAVLSRGEQTVFRSLLGKVSWIALQTRSDIAYETNQLSMSMSAPTAFDVKRLNALVRNLQKHSNVVLRLVRIPTVSRIHVLTDANYGEKCTAGFVVAFGSLESNAGSLVKWSSSKIRRVTTSSTSSEAFALRDGIECAIQTQHIMNDLSGICCPIVCFTDSRPLRHSCYSRTKLTIREFNVQQIVKSIREKLELGEISEVRYIHTKDNLADFLTKPIPNKELLFRAMSQNSFSLPST